MKRKSDSKQILNDEYSINGTVVGDNTIKTETSKETGTAT